MYYDLHIHSALSPCADNDMTISNILNMSIIKELDLISITDHNSLKQYASLLKVIENYDIKVIIGVEVQTREDIHVCCYFKSYEKSLVFQNILETKHPLIKNRKDYFGDQLILGVNDEIIDEEDLLLLVSLDLGIKEVCDLVHELDGSIVLAHVLDRGNSIITQLGFIPPDLKYEGIEVKNEEQILMIKKTHPWIQDTLWFLNSDAHHLEDINEKRNYLTTQQLKQFWRE